MTSLKTIQDVKSVGAETLAYQIYQSDVNLATLAQNVLRAISKHIKPVRDELMKEYTTGDAMCYPPDWYDHYVFPLDCAITMCNDEIQARYNDDDSEEDSEW
jgi:hypothetical protein